ncbi:MAG: hypothetical protein ACKOEO_18690, partial [Planctomycetaceae bacterium]
MSDFIYVNGNVAIDIGNWVKVTVNTGIPASLAALMGSDTLQSLRSALSSFSSSLNNAESSMNSAFQSLVDEVQSQINSLCNSIADRLYDHLTDKLDDLEAAVQTLATDALEAATSSLSESFAQLVRNQLSSGFLNVATEEPLRSLVQSTITDPLEGLLKAAFRELLQQALSEAIGPLVAGVPAALQTLTDNLDQLEEQVKTAIVASLQPQVVLIRSKLAGLKSAIDSRLKPVLDRLHQIADITVGDSFTTLGGIETEVTTVGVSDARAFIGRPPAKGLDWTRPLSSQDAIGLFVDNFNLAVGIFKPTLSQSLPEFTAARMTIGEAGFTDGGADVLTLTVENVDVLVNTGKPLIAGAQVLRNATIDFPLSFPAEAPRQPGYAVATGTYTRPVYLDFTREIIEASVGNVTIAVSDFIYLAGSVSLRKGGAQWVSVTDGPAAGLLKAGLDVLDITLPEAGSIPATGAKSTEVEFLTIGAADLTGFVGMGGPRRKNTRYRLRVSDTSDTLTLGYGARWSQLAINDDDSDAALRMKIVQALSLLDFAQEDLRVTGGRQFGFTIEFINRHSGDDVSGLQLLASSASGTTLSKTQTGQTNENAIGLVIEDFDLAMALMTPTNAVEAALGIKYFALQGSAGEISMAGVPDLTVEARRLMVEFNWSTPVFYGFPLFPVVDFAATSAFAGEEKSLFDENKDATLTRGDLATLNHLNNSNLAALNSIALNDSTPADYEWLLTVLDLSNDGVIDLAEAQQVFGDTPDARATVAARDIDNDEKIDPTGYEVSTGAAPVWFDMDSVLARASGYINLDVLGTVTFTGNFAFELGPTKQVEIVTAASGSGGTARRTLRTMTVGASSVYGFMGWNGPWFIDGNKDGVLNRDSEGNPLPGETSGEAKGFALNNLNVGLFIGLDTSLTNPAGFLAMQFDLDSFETVGLPFLQVDATLHVSLNAGLSLNSVSAVDFRGSFGAKALFDLDADGDITVTELRTLHGAAEFGGLFNAQESGTRVIDYQSVFSAVDANHDGTLTTSEARAFMTGDYSSRPDQYDSNHDNVIDDGLAVNTGDPAHPVLLTFDKLLAEVEIAGVITITAGSISLAQLAGVFYLEADASEFKLFANGVVKLGPDISSAKPLISLNALAVVVVNASGVAAEMRSTTNLQQIGISYNSTSGIRLNSTAQD